jgi:hypothetical protein
LRAFHDLKSDPSTAVNPRRFAARWSFAEIGLGLPSLGEMGVPMRVAPVALLSMALVISTPALALSDQFDLICAATVTIQGTLESRPINRRYKIDLRANQWCANECASVKAFSEVSPTQLVFEEVKASFKGDPSERLDFVKRDTGEWMFFSATWQGKGTCEPAAFSGFPTVKTKF